MSNSPPAIEPFFLPGQAGELFALCTHPAPGTDNGVGVLYCPPFGEEQNRTRVTVGRCARALSALGYTVLQVDLYGTGDSQGEFAEGGWATWTDDLLRAAEWLSGQGDVQRLSLWGLRLGVPLALSVLAKLPEQQAMRVLAWHPVIAGKQFLSQFLRLRVAAGLMDEQTGETVGSLREQLANGQTLEVGGYAVSAALAQDLDNIDLKGAHPAAPVDWLEIVSNPERPLTPISRKLIEQWEAQGVQVSAQSIVGETFWSTPEIVVPQALIDATCQRARAWLG